MKLLERWLGPVCVAAALFATTAAGTPPPIQPLGDEDWLQPGPYQWGRTFYSGTFLLDDTVWPHPVMISYPADEGGLDVPVAAAGGPFPIVFFEHAAGNTYDIYGYLFELLASRGFVVASIDHSEIDGCSPCPYWELHVGLLTETMQLLDGWNQDEASPFHGAFDLERIGISGHSHGGGAMLEAANILRPIDPAGPYEVKSITLLAPCPKGAVPMADYPVEYAGLPPLQVIYGSKDRDGCVANGQAIASYEPVTRPRHFSYVIGASHNGFAEGTSLAEATIDHEAHWRAAASSMNAWFSLTLKDDLSALPFLRNDQPLVESSPEVRYQFHEPDFEPIDDGEPLGETPGVAIAHVPGQAFVNGFLSDTFADFEAGVQLVREQIAALHPDEASGPAAVLFLEDALRGDSVYAEALGREATAGRIVGPVFTTDHDEFASLLTGGNWDLVVMAIQAGTPYATYPSDRPMKEYLCGGGKAIISDFRFDSPPAGETLQCVLTRLNGTTNWSEMTLASDPGRVFAMTNPGWGVWSFELETEAQVWATNENLSAIGSDPSTNRMGLTVVASDLDTFAEIDALDEPRTLYHPTGALELAWSVPGARLTQVVSPMWSPGFDASSLRTLSFRALQIDGDPLNLADQPVDFDVSVVDRDGRRATLALSDVAPAAVRPAAEPSVRVERKSVFETYRIPLEHFLELEAQLDLSRLDSVELRFDRTATGRIVVDDLEFVTQCTGELSTPVSVGNRLRVDLVGGELRLDWSEYPSAAAVDRFRVYRAEAIAGVPGEVVAEPVATEWPTAPTGTIEFFDVRAINRCSGVVEESPD